jgi:hypothetical protein
MELKEGNTYNKYIQTPELEIHSKYTLDKGSPTECEVILLDFGQIFGTVMLPYTAHGQNKPKTWDVMLNRLSQKR